MKVLVTGATGLLGHRVTMELLGLGHQVNIIVRTTNNIFFDLNSVQVFKGNFTDYEQLKAAASGCDAVIHIAAVTDVRLLHYEDYRKINVEGSAQIIRVCRELAIRRVVYISSSNTIGFGSKNKPATEDFPFQYPFTRSFYAKSKVEAEKLFQQFASEFGMHVIIIHPTFMIGSYDVKPSSGKLLLLGYRKPLLFIPKGGKNFVPVRDVSMAVCNALTLGKNGEHYLAAGVNLSFKEYYRLQKEIAGYRQMIIEVPDFLLKILGRVGDLLRFLGIKTDVCTMNLSQLMIQEYYCGQKAVKELDMPQTDLKIAIVEAIDWFKKQGRIR
ncbi:MAG TPA: NAD-dependent epimerase/dehydratase family protein [Paludibacteraceae bacterium]|jgi:dihydroflavonol-4-reductase|nr:NAD-dependent epimerase/dehydratase family protein [Paludibacteraceae bacterium]